MHLTDKDGMIETEEEEAQKELTSEMSLVEEDDGETEEEEGERESSVEHNGTAGTQINTATQIHTDKHKYTLRAIYCTVDQSTSHRG